MANLLLIRWVAVLDANNYIIYAYNVFSISFPVGLMSWIKFNPIWVPAWQRLASRAASR
jgi:hypothetical protein